MKNCVHCGNSVSLGDRHSRSNCPPIATGRKFALKRLARKRAKRAGVWNPKRGEAVAGTGVPKGANKG